MGAETIRAVLRQEDMALVAAVDPSAAGKQVSAFAGGQTELRIAGDLAAHLAGARPEVLVDFTLPEAVMANVRAGLKSRVACVVGTTGLKPADLEEIAQLCEEERTPAFVAPNFALGAVLMMQFAARAARYFEKAEIIELHHDEKKDAPSGTALRTAELMARAEGSLLAGEQAEAPAPSRGLGAGRIRVHSVRLPGLVAHQEVIFGGLGQTLSIRHDSVSRESFMPGVLLAIRKVRGLRGLVVGLENLL
jgi:4-hydroxy-tetrahydrodipicolinate reductase